MTPETTAPVPQRCTCGEVERQGEELLRTTGNAVHRFSGRPCFDELDLHDLPAAPEVDNPPILGVMPEILPDGVHETDGVWEAVVDGKLIASGPDEPLIRAAYLHHLGEPVDTEEPSTPAETVTEPSQLARDLGADTVETFPSHADALAEAARRIPRLLTDRATGVSYMLTGLDDGRVEWTCKATGCETSAIFDDPEVGFVTIRRHCDDEHPPPGTPSPCNLADCTDPIEGTVTINVPSVGEETVQRTLGICGAHLRMIDRGEITGFAFSPEYRS